MSLSREEIDKTVSDFQKIANRQESKKTASSSKFLLYISVLAIIVIAVIVVLYYHQKKGKKTTPSVTNGTAQVAGSPQAPVQVVL